MDTDTTDTASTLDNGTSRKTLAESFRLLAETLGDTEFDVKTAADVLGVKANGVSVKLKLLCGAGVVARVQRGRYRLSVELTDIAQHFARLAAADGRRTSWSDERRAAARERAKARAAA